MCRDKNLKNMQETSRGEKIMVGIDSGNSSYNTDVTGFVVDVMRCVDIDSKCSTNSSSNSAVSNTNSQRRHHKSKGIIIKAITNYNSWFSSLKRTSTSRQNKITNSRLCKSAWDISSTSTVTTVTSVTSTTTTSIYSNKQLKDELGEVVAEMENMDTADDSKNHTRTKQMSIGRKKFNMDPKKGIEYLLEHGLLQATSEDVAAFLYKGEGLNKTAIGDYLGERNEFNEKVLRAFVELHDFTDLILVQALRQFLWSFRLPGEAQKIDRMMECFAQRYCQLNPNIFTNTDTCYVLSFAIIMLNTSLHNPSVKDKPTVEQFISMNRGINNGGDLPRELLESLYDSIKTEPFKIPEDDGNDLMHTFFNPDKEGWLWKQGGRYKSWKRRWFILNDNCLYYFEYTTDKEPRGIIPLENIQVREVSDRHKPHCFELYAAGTDFIKACKTDSEGKVVEGKHTVYRMSAATSEEKDEWIKCVRQSISHNPFYDMLAARKKKAQKTNTHHHHHHHHARS
ncbi:cytohesin steppke isoform X1 [Lycorma delicatula]|uniref:cytohesin steppke isoform X1 n=2 Tax=Lycorma delicatula TaxID=130591 RepID=UPI003F51594F